MENNCGEKGQRDGAKEWANEGAKDGANEGAKVGGCFDWRLAWRERRLLLFKELAKQKAESVDYGFAFRLTNVVQELVDRDEPDLLVKCLEICGSMVRLDDYLLCRAKSRETVRVILNYREKPSPIAHPFLLLGAKTLSALEGLVIYGGVDVDAHGSRCSMESMFSTLLDSIIDSTKVPGFGKSSQTSRIALVEAEQQPVRCAVKLVMLGASLFAGWGSEILRINMESLLLQRENAKECKELFSALQDACSERLEQVRRMLQPHLVRDLHDIVAAFYDIQPNDLPRQFTIRDS